MATLTISLPDSLKEFIDREVQTKGYGNVSEYVRELLRQAQAKNADAHLEALLIEGLTTGKDAPLSPEFWSELRKDAAKIVARHKKARKGRRKR
jgi:antitoxin ParD1/3/4